MDRSLKSATHITNKTRKDKAALKDIAYYVEVKGLSSEEAMMKVQTEQFEEEHSPRTSDFI